MKYHVYNVAFIKIFYSKESKLVDVTDKVSAKYF